LRLRKTVAGGVEIAFAGKTSQVPRMAAIQAAIFLLEATFQNEHHGREITWCLSDTTSCFFNERIEGDGRITLKGSGGGAL
jgi:hypothetical protein